MATDLAKSVTVVEVAHATEMQEDLRRRLREAQKKDAGGRMDSVRASVLAAVVSESYDRGKEDLKAYVLYKSSYPLFQERVERHVQHCCDLIDAIKTKRNFPGMASLSMSKQQELHEKVLEHFEELKQVLKHIEKVERDHKLTDVRSTVWVVRTMSYAVGAIVLTALIVDVREGMLTSLSDVVQSLLDDASIWVVSHLPFLK